jgi:hypothetical protein
MKVPSQKEVKLDDQVFFAPREIFDKAGSKRSVPNEESIVSNYGDERGLIWQSHKIPLGIKKT